MSSDHMNMQGSFCICAQLMRDDNVTSSLIGWVHTRNEPWIWWLHWLETDVAADKISPSLLCVICVFVFHVMLLRHLGRVIQDYLLLWVMAGFVMVIAGICSTCYCLIQLACFQTCHPMGKLLGTLDTGYFSYCSNDWVKLDLLMAQGEMHQGILSIVCL